MEGRHNKRVASGFLRSVPWTIDDTLQKLCYYGLESEKLG